MTEENKETIEASGVTHVLPEDVPEEQKYPNIPNDVVDELKAKYRIIFGSYFGEKPVLYRTFNVQEYLRYQTDFLEVAEQIQSDEADKPDAEKLSDAALRDLVASKSDASLVEMFTVYPETFMKDMMNGDYPGGVLYTLSQAIFANNGFVELEPIILNMDIINEDPEILKDLDNGVLSSFDDMDSTKLVEEIIKPNKEVVLLWFLNQLYIVRGLSLDEFNDVKQITANLDPVRMSVELVKRFTVYPYGLDLDKVPAGMVVKGLPDAILMISGFGTTTPDIVIMD